MSETTTAASSAAKKAAEKTAAVVTDTLPTVVETVEVAMEVPAKVVLNQKLVVAVSTLAGAGLAVGAMWGVKKFKAYKASKNEVAVPDDISSLDDEAKKA